MNARRGVAEIGLFAVAGAIGVYGLGEGLNGFFETGTGGVLWLPVAAVALMVLARQMGRVQDRWPRRPSRPGAVSRAPAGPGDAHGGADR